jgi:hypothetical protein
MTEYGKPVQKDEWDTKRATGERQAQEWNPCFLRAKIENLKAELIGAQRLAAWRLTECDTLEKDLRQLTAWKENAISRFPELGEEGE